MGEARQFKAVREARRAHQRLRAGDGARGRRRAPRAGRRAARARRATASRSTTCCYETLRARAARPASARSGMRHFDVQLIGGMVLHDGVDRRDADRRGQDAHRDAAGRPQLARRQGRPPRHGQRLPRPPRRRVDEADLRRARRDASACCRTCSPTRTSGPPTPADVTYGTNSEFGFDYLRDNMATSLEEKVQHGGRRSATDGGHPAHLRDRRRGRQHPDRRGPHAADHLRRARAGRRPLRAVRPPRAADGGRQDARGHGPEGEEGRSSADFDFEFDEKHKTVVGHRAAASPRPRSSSASTTSTAPRTATWSTT